MRLLPYVGAFVLIAATAVAGNQDSKPRPPENLRVLPPTTNLKIEMPKIAKALGAHVTGVCSTRNVELVRSIGADRVVDYTREDFTRSGERWDVILDNVGLGNYHGKITTSIINILNGQPYDLPKKSIAEALYKIATEKGGAAAVSRAARLAQLVLDARLEQGRLSHAALAVQEREPGRHDVPDHDAGPALAGEEPVRVVGREGTKADVRTRYLLLGGHGRLWLTRGAPPSARGRRRVFGSDRGGPRPPTRPGDGRTHARLCSGSRRPATRSQGR